jgi:hypothetical protein
MKRKTKKIISERILAASEFQERGIYAASTCFEIGALKRAKARASFSN